jgi:hypothetical protein
MQRLTESRFGDTAPSCVGGPSLKPSFAPCSRAGWGGLKSVKKVVFEAEMTHCGVFVMHAAGDATGKASRKYH